MAQYSARLILVCCEWIACTYVVSLTTTFWLFGCVFWEVKSCIPRRRQKSNLLCICNIYHNTNRAYIYLIIMELGQIFVCTNLQNWLKNSQRTQTKLLSAVRGVTLTGISIVSLRNEGFSTFYLMLNYGPPSWVYGEITEFTKQTDVRELLQGQCCDSLFAILAVSCMRPYVL